MTDTLTLSRSTRPGKPSCASVSRAAVMANLAIVAHAQRRERMRELFGRRRRGFIAVAEAMGVADAASYVDLCFRTSQAERCNSERALDPVSGEWLTGVELLQRVEMGEEFSRRRGYSAEECRDHAEWLRRTRSMIDAGVASEDLQWLGGVIAGDLPLLRAIGDKP